MGLQLCALLPVGSEARVQTLGVRRDPEGVDGDAPICMINRTHLCPHFGLHLLHCAKQPHPIIHPYTDPYIHCST